MKTNQDIEKLVTDYLGWADKLSTRYFNAYGLPERDYDDIKQIGRVGLWRAAEKYDPSRGRFASHAKWWIEGQIKTHAGLYYWTTPSKDRPGRRRIKEIEYNSFPDELWNSIKFSTNGTAKRVADKDMVTKVLAKIPLRLANVLRAYLMEGYTLQEIGDQLGVCRERARQLRDKGLITARRAMGGVNCQKGLY